MKNLLIFTVLFITSCSLIKKSHYPETKKSVGSICCIEHEFGLDELSSCPKEDSIKSCISYEFYENKKKMITVKAKYCGPYKLIYK